MTAAGKPGTPLLPSIAYGLLMLYAVVLGFVAPFRNWDMLCYVGSVSAWSLAGAQRIYDATMAAVNAAVPDWIMAQFVANPLSANAAAFVQVLPFCQVKPLYNAGLWAWNSLSGSGLPRASWSVSALCFALLAWVLFRWRTRNLAHPLWLILVLGLSFLGALPMAALARFSTPDAMATSFTMAAICQGVCWRRFGLFALFGWLACLARPDAAVLIGMISLYWGCFAPHRTRTGAAAAAVYILLLGLSMALTGHWASSYGYEKMYVYTFFNRTPNPATELAPLTVDGFLAALSGGAALFLGETRVIVLLILAALGGLCHYLRPHPTNRQTAELLTVTLLALAGRFILWPAWGEDRFYYAYFLMILFCSGELIAVPVRPAWAALQAYRRRPHGDRMG